MACLFENENPSRNPFRTLPRFFLSLFLPPSLFLVLFTALAAAEAPAAVKLPAVFGDNMVLQRGMEAPIFGWADGGETVAVQGSWMAAPLETTAGPDGRWLVRIPVPGESGPFTITIAGKEGRVVLENVAAGEVWVCSGQSNMEMCLDKIHAGYHGVLNYKEEIAAADWPMIRLFTVPNRLSAVPESDCGGAWQVCTPETAKGFSAAGYFFGRKIHRALGVPVGLISADWGGTPAEAWTPAGDLAAMKDFAPALEKLRAMAKNPDLFERDYREKMAAWRDHLAATDRGTAGGWMRPGIDDSSWKAMDLPGAWEDKGLPGFDGIVWFRKEVVLPPAMQGKDLVLELGPIDDMDVAWFNGKRVGGIETMNYWQTPRVYKVPASLVRAGRNVIVLRVYDFGGAGGVCGRKEQMALRLAGKGEGGRISLAGPWRFFPGCTQTELGPMPLRQNVLNSHTPTVLFNGMIAPLIPYGIRGAIWYQGESNRLRAAQYRTLFPLMIRAWRKAWGERDFPFDFVQIAPFRYGGDPTAAAKLREAQLMALSVKNTGMAVTVDIGNPGNIHPSNKQEVGRRLALWALARTYGRKGIVFSGPIYKAMKKEGKRIRLFFDHVGGGLAPRDAELTCFTVAGKDRIFKPARAVIDGDTVVVSSDEVPSPVAVRFAFSDAPEPNLRNEEGLPASPFRTDSWED